ncbi:cytochrome C oxidase subunit IV family protein [Hydrogenophilus thermoluteolus]|uniref:Cytochrome C oxidase subunit IV n=1 Tax=Hydrogenophilus thermoluteolus TaxID=297 RepID=A0A2Z6DXM0_HYDTE|nr:cytochrome C oxidase subunit IV family protein [Hydrogenophilus thermoluteolus]BBD77197.1 hypothetical protein HPTL_0929 [Hydrogenophilus thermoluteolus]
MKNAKKNPAVAKRSRLIDVTALVLLVATVGAAALSEWGRHQVAGEWLSHLLLLLAVGKGLAVVDVFMDLRSVVWRWRGLIWAWVAGVVAICGVLILGKS